MGLHQSRRGGCAGGPVDKGRSGNPLGRRVGCRNKTTIAAASLLAGWAEALTRKAVEQAPVGDPTAMGLCHERILPRRPIESAADIAGAMKAVTSALAGRVIRPGEAATIAAELATPDLDLIKQEEQVSGTGAGGSRRAGRAIPPAGRAAGGPHLGPGDRHQRLRTPFAAGRGRLLRPPDRRGRQIRHPGRAESGGPEIAALRSQ